MQALFKHAKNFVGDATRPIFQGIYFDGENAVVTNTHLLVMVQNQPASEKRILHWKTGQPIEGTYPDVRRIIPEKMQTEFTIPDICKWLPFLKTAIAVSSGNTDIKAQYPVILTGDAKAITLKTYTPYEQYTVMLQEGVTQSFEVMFNVKYLYDLFAFFKDIDAIAVTWGLNAPNSPMKLTTEKGALAVLTPIRTPTNENRS